MSLSQKTAMNVVPLLARVVLALCFTVAGYTKLRNYDTFEGPAAASLRSMGVQDKPAPAPTPVTASLVAFQDTTPPVTPPAARPATPPANTPAVTPPAVTPPAVTPPAVSSEPLRAQQLYHIAVMLVGTPFEPWAVWLAWAAACTELVGGFLILIGFFSRIWGLGLATTMGFAFWLTSWPALVAAGGWDVLLKLAADGSTFSTMCLQLSLFVLAFGIFLTGPGAASLDHIVFGRTKSESDDD